MVKTVKIDLDSLGQSKSVEKTRRRVADVIQLSQAKLVQSFSTVCQRSRSYIAGDGVLERFMVCKTWFFDGFRLFYVRLVPLVDFKRFPLWRQQTGRGHPDHCMSNGRIRLSDPHTVAIRAHLRFWINLRVINVRIIILIHRENTSAIPETVAKNYFRFAAATLGNVEGTGQASNSHNPPSLKTPWNFKVRIGTVPRCSANY